MSSGEQMSRVPALSGPTNVLDRAVAEVVASKERWARLPLTDKRSRLNAVRRRTLRAMDRWVALALSAKRIDPDSAWAGSEWGIGPYFFLLGLTAVHDTVAALERGQLPRLPYVSTRADGRVVVRVYPATTFDRVLSAGMTAEAWMQRDVTPSNLPDTMAAFYRQANPVGKVVLVLGAGNLVTLGLLDLLHKLYVEGHVVVLKLNPIVDYMQPVLADILAPWITGGFVRVVSGGTEVGAYLANHPDVDEIHLTGGLATHDALVFGTGPEGSRRKASNHPRIGKRVTSELGGVSPVIVLPGPWTRADIVAQADKIVGMKLNNSGHNCMSAQVLVLPAEWPAGGSLLTEIERQIRLVPPQLAFYTGAAERQQALVERHPDALQFPSVNVPRTLIWGLDPNTVEEPCFTSEVFGPVLAQTSLPASTPEAYLRNAVAFANRRLSGTLAATLLVHPTTQSELGDELDVALQNLDYGTVAVNDWHGMAAILPQCPWGGAPGRPLNDVQSGRGFVHNSFMFDRPAKTILRNSFHPAPRAWRHGELQLLTHPLYSATWPLGPVSGRRLARMAGEPRWRHLPGLLSALVRRH